MNEHQANSRTNNNTQNRINWLYTGMSKSILSQLDQRKLITYVKEYKPTWEDIIRHHVDFQWWNQKLQPLLYTIRFHNQTYVVRRTANTISYSQDNHLNIPDRLKINKLLYNYLQQCMIDDQIQWITVKYFDIACIDPNGKFIVIEYKQWYKNLLEHQIKKILEKRNNKSSKERDRLHQKHERIKTKLIEFWIDIVDKGIKTKQWTQYNYQDMNSIFRPDPKMDNILYGGVDWQDNDIFYLMDLFYIESKK